MSLTNARFNTMLRVSVSPLFIQWAANCPIEGRVNMLKKLKEFGSDQRGNVVIMTAVLVVPLLVVIGAAVDTGRLQQSKRNLHSALEAAVLGACNRNAVEQNLQAKLAHAIFNANVQKSGITKELDGGFFAEEIDEDNIRVVYTVAAKVDSFLPKLADDKEHLLFFKVEAMCHPKSGRPATLIKPGAKGRFEETTS